MSKKAVYPRWRGEHPVWHMNESDERGLSPLARGTLNNSANIAADMRFIPAGAGNTYFRTDYRRCNTVYPRWRGEHASRADLYISPRGLSPLARGTRAARWRRSLEQRFIPAGAGNTPTVRCVPLFIAVYPRWRGEHGKRRRHEAPEDGLSPLARGTLVVAQQLQPGERVIPAGAGNTPQFRRHFGCQPVYPRWRGEHIRIKSEDVLDIGLSPLARGTHDK